MLHGFHTKDDRKSARAREKEIHKVLGDDPEAAHLIPTWQDIDVLESIQAALGPITDFTDMLSGEKLRDHACPLFCLCYTYSRMRS